jgi:hypothetical protein
LGLFTIIGGYQWTGSALGLVGTPQKQIWRNHLTLDVRFNVNGSSLEVQANLLGENPTTVLAEIADIQAIRGT